jgi:hypothetical protein
MPFQVTAIMPDTKPPPVCKAILLFDQVIIDAISERISLIGIFDVLGFSSFPHETQPFAAYVELVDGIGKYALTIEVNDLQAGTILARQPAIELEFPERVNKAVLLINCARLHLPQEGAYDFVVFADNQEIDRQKFVARTVQAWTDQGDSEDA